MFLQFSSKSLPPNIRRIVLSRDQLDLLNYGLSFQIKLSSFPDAFVTELDYKLQPKSNSDDEGTLFEHFNKIYVAQWLTRILNNWKIKGPMALSAQL